MSRITRFPITRDKSPALFGSPLYSVEEQALAYFGEKKKKNIGNKREILNSMFSQTNRPIMIINISIVLARLAFVEWLKTTTIRWHSELQHLYLLSISSLQVYKIFYSPVNAFVC